MAKTIHWYEHRSKQKMAKLMNNAVFEKTMKNMRKHRDIKLTTTERRRNYFLSFSQNILEISFKKCFANSQVVTAAASCELFVNNVFFGYKHCHWNVQLILSEFYDFAMFSINSIMSTLETFFLHHLYD